MAKKEFTYKGKNLSELKKMNTKEFAELLPSSARRSILRGLNKDLHQKINKAIKNNQKNEILRTHKRSAIVTPQMIGFKIGIHSGNQFKVVEITKEMLGHRLGELAMTRKKLKHGKAGIGATKSSTAITARG